MTLIFDPLTLKVCCRSSVTLSDSVPNFSEIEQFADELLIMQSLFAYFYAPVKVRGGLGGISESRFQGHCNFKALLSRRRLSSSMLGVFRLLSPF